MKLRLQITSASGSSSPFEHSGPSVRIGRDPDQDLVLPAWSNGSVAPSHARIDLAPEGATLSDLGSATGTYVNDRRIAERALLQVGDRIHLGADGPMLQVVELDLSPAAAAGQGWWQDFANAPPPAADPPQPPAVVPPPAAALPEPRLAGITPTAPAPIEPVGAPKPPQAAAWWQEPPPPEPVAASKPHTPPPPSMAHLAEVLGQPATPAPGSRLGSSAVLLAVGLIGLIGLVILIPLSWKWLRPNKPGPEPSASVPKEDPSKISAVTPPAEPILSNAQLSAWMKAVVESIPPDKPVAPELQVRDVGQYLSPEKAPPSVLLQRQSASEPWGRLRPGSKIQTSYSLVSLPGYRSQIRLDCNVVLTLWGNVPAFSPYPPVLESSVVLNVPETGVDLDFTLDHGRVHLANARPSGAVQVRVRFQQEVWDLTLPDGTSEVVLELWGFDVPADLFETKPPPGPGARIDMYVKGKASLQTGKQSYSLADRAYFRWTSVGTPPVAQATLPALPAWWTTRLAPDRPEVTEMMLGLVDFSELLAKKAVVLDAVLTAIRESSDAGVRRLGVLFLGAMDAVLPLVDCLEDRQHPEVRNSAVYALRRWISRGPDQQQELANTLLEKKGYTQEKTDLILGLLRSCSPEAKARPQTYTKLIALLGHENLAIRELAMQNLAILVPEGAKKITYDPAADEEKREPAIAQWKKLIPEGKLPRT